jgi:leucyl aminopeptidase
MYRSISISRSAGRLKVTTSFAIARAGAVPQGRDAGSLASALRGVAIPPDAGASLILDARHIALSLGVAEGLDATRMRSVGARLGRTLVSMGAQSISIAGAGEWAASAATRRELGQALAEGVLLGSWRFDSLDGSATRRPPRLGSLRVNISDAAASEGFEYGLRVGAAVNAARHVAATPPNIANPGWIANEARRLGRQLGMRVRVIDFARAKALGMGGLVAVGQGSAAKPCLVTMEWRPRRASARAKDAHLVLVGKTITYDTGGYSLKVNNGMKGMKYDKCGGAAVLGAMRAIASLKLSVRVTGVLAVAENMVSDDSYRPDDIIKLHNGVTVEVTNTDAEGRLVLADALSYACKELKPTTIVDIATLTGGVGVALGSFCAGYFCENAALAGRVERAAQSTAELIWRLPLWEQHREFMRSQHADIINSNPLRSAHPIQGAAFLSYFVEPKLPWAHLDIAAVANSDGPNDLTGVGPTGWGVRLLVELADSLC